MSNKLENWQGGIMKRVCGIGKQSHHSQPLRVLNITSFEDILLKSVASLYRGIFAVESPLRTLYFRSGYLFMRG
jgi:hypothetical protein